MYKLGIIGFGNMGNAIVQGAINSGIIKPNEILVFDVDERKNQVLKKIGANIAKNENEVFAASNKVLLAIIPQLFSETLKKIDCGKLPKEQIVLSIAAGITSDYIRSFLGKDAKIINIMPNTPLIIGLGATALSRTSNVSKAEFDEVVDLFKQMGEVAVLDESKLMEIVPANGSGPALVYYFINSIATAISKKGIDKDLAIKMAAKTFIGAASMMLETGKSPEELIEQVCSPGGMTIEAIKTFDDENLSEIVEKACNNCVNRGHEMSREFNEKLE